VVGRLEPEQAPALGVPERLPARVERRYPDLLRRQQVAEITTEPLVAETAPDVLVAGDEPARTVGVVEDACALANAIELGIGIAQESGSPRIEVERLR
jgi:hypothetical protein